MNYTEISINTADAEQSEVLMAELSDWPFESFTEESAQLKAYIKSDAWADYTAEVAAFLSGGGYVWSHKEIEEVNWNAVWESNFEAIAVENRCLIRAPFHAADPTMEYEAVIMPKMSFGTGHHATTYLMTAMMLDCDFRGKRGLDMGSGTGVLAIFAAKMGAVQLDAIDIDAWAFENCGENVAANGVADRVTPLLGDVSLLVGKQYDFVLANINRNILLCDMEAYVGTLSAGGTLLLSGILEADLPMIRSHAESIGLRYVTHRMREGWVGARFACK